MICFSRFDPVDEIEPSSVLDLSYLQNSLSKDGLRGMGSNRICSTNLFSTMTTAMTTPTDVDSFMSLLDDTTTTNSTTGDIDFQLNDYNNFGGIELQLPILSPALSNTIISSPSLSLSSLSTTAITATAISSPFDIVLSGHFNKTEVQTCIQKAYATMIIDMIHAYPRMMMRRETFPPFVHACSPAGDTEVDQSRLPEHLKNCMGIAQLFAVCNDDTRSFVKATMLAEIREFGNRISMFNKYEAFSALQATLLYMIMRTVDHSAQEAKDDCGMILIHEVFWHFPLFLLITLEMKERVERKYMLNT